MDIKKKQTEFAKNKFWKGFSGFFDTVFLSVLKVEYMRTLY